MSACHTGQSPIADVTSDFIEACTGDEIPGLWRLGALKALLSSIDESVLEHVEDPQSWREIIAECQTLHDLLAAAVRKAMEKEAV